jgi:hypothetical protein
MASSVEYLFAADIRMADRAARGQGWHPYGRTGWIKPDGNVVHFICFEEQLSVVGTDVTIYFVGELSWQLKRFKQKWEAAKVRAGFVLRHSFDLELVQKKVLKNGSLTTWLRAALTCHAMPVALVSLAIKLALISGAPVSLFVRFVALKFLGVPLAIWIVCANELIGFCGAWNDVFVVFLNGAFASDTVGLASNRTEAARTERCFIDEQRRRRVSPPVGYVRF